MTQRSRRTALLALVVVLVCFLALACGSDTGTEPTGESEQPPAAMTPESPATAEKPTDEPEAVVEEPTGSTEAEPTEPTEAPEEAQEEPTDAVDELPSQPAPENFSIMAADALAPMSILSRAGDPDEIEDPPYLLFEMDQVGNVHMFVDYGWTREGALIEAYMVDGLMYRRIAESGEFETGFELYDDRDVLEEWADPMKLFSAESIGRGTTEILPLHGILWLGAYESVEEQGAETVNGYATDKYKLVIDVNELSEFSEDLFYRPMYDPFVLGEDGDIVYVWVERNSRAVVKAEWRTFLEGKLLSSTIEVTPLDSLVFEPPSVSE